MAEILAAKMEFFGHGIRLRWEDTEGWFGIIDLYDDGHGLKLETEHTGREHVMKILEFLVQHAEMLDE